MAIIQETIHVKVPIRTAYDQWTHFEDFPRFMRNVDQVTQLDPTTLEWRASIAGVEKRWRARIIELVPDRRIAWTSTDGPRNDGTVTFDRLAADLTRVTLQLHVEPDGPLESAGTALELVRGSVHSDLQRFQDFIEARGSLTGASRGGDPRPNRDPSGGHNASAGIRRSSSARATTAGQIPRHQPTTRA